MPFREEMERSGNRLFRWRSYLPLMLVGIVLLAFRNYEYPMGDHRRAQLWEMICLAVSVCGLAVRCLTVGTVPKGTSGRNTSGQKATALNTTGMYSIVRHPLYLGNFMIWLGIALFPRLWWFALIMILLFWVYYERIIFAEEEFLRERFGEAYLRWAEQTPLIVPRLKGWTAPSLPFSFRTVVKREHHTLFAIVSVFTALEVLGDLFVEGRIDYDPLWVWLFGVALLFYLVARVIRKHTRWLDEIGR